ncbi:MAG: hypothetical protein EPO20_22940 [Betaproteobacteria bacterium]|nr:MAG: hypothetical protein EPO20_22940 [Betaproteobacteria bacterium]
MLKPTSRLKEPPLKALAIVLTGIAVSLPAVAQTRDEGQTNHPADSSKAYRLLFATALEADSQYRVDIGISQDHDGSVKVKPRIAGPAGKTVRYEVDVRSESRGAASANSSQSGSVRLDDSGNAQLSSNAVTLSPREKYEMTVRLFDGNRLLAEQSARVP